MKYLLIAIFLSLSLSASEKIEYKKSAQGKLFLHVTKPGEWKASDKRPAIVFFFGGGWTGGSPKQFIPHCEYFAKLGFVTFSAEYRIKNLHKTSPFESVKDGKSAVRYLRENCKALGIDPNKIIAAGGSAGGHVAACTSIIQGFEEGNKKISSKPNALLLFNPALDLTWKADTAKRFKDKAYMISPNQNIKESVAPTLVMVGDKDTTTPLKYALDFQKKMKEKGNSCKVISYKDQVHGFFNTKNPEMYKKTLTDCEAFLKEIKFLD